MTIHIGGLDRVRAIEHRITIRANGHVEDHIGTTGDAAHNRGAEDRSVNSNGDVEDITDTNESVGVITVDTVMSRGRLDTSLGDVQVGDLRVRKSLGVQHNITQGACEAVVTNRGGSFTGGRAGPRERGHLAITKELAINEERNLKSARVDFRRGRHGV